MTSNYLQGSHTNAQFLIYECVPNNHICLDAVQIESLKSLLSTCLISLFLNFLFSNLLIFSSRQSSSLLEPWVNFFSFLGIIAFFFLTCEKVQHWQLTKEYRFQIVDKLTQLPYLLHTLTVREPHIPCFSPCLPLFRVVHCISLCFFFLPFLTPLSPRVAAWVSCKQKRLAYFLSSRSSVRLVLCHTSSFSATKSSATWIEKVTYDLFSNLCYEIISDSDRKGDLWRILQVWCEGDTVPKRE